MDSEKCADFRMGRCTRGATCKYVHDMSQAPASGGFGEVEKCGDFKTGKCTRGASCKFSHDLGGASVSGSPLPPPPVSNAASSLLGPYLDPNTGRYYYCNMATGQSEWAPATMAVPMMQAAPMQAPMMQVPTAQAATMQMGSTGVAGDVPACGDFKNGKCLRGASCKFSHGTADRLGTSSMFSQVDSRPACGDFKLGRCQRGSSCKFSHGGIISPSSAMSMTSSREECADFKRGECSRGASCKFAHTARAECADFRMGKCNRDNCKFLHVSKDGRRSRSRSR
eukprot:TRINITY_DN46759_c0_g1_i1.p2 TRINITY_DN46759_c0_g1~~TRINITY_DN46759_c0_g1_i1.p2  ORF type:complete len:282 (-),score=53.72 TRINITY_DN46759_c0_g1_i1:132-977(-)